jgi:hypothetical protein
MKRIVVVLIALTVLFSFGTANAVSLSQGEIQRGAKALAGSYGLWFPSAIDATIPSIGADWTWVLVIANWYGDNITINVTATAFSTDPNNAPTTKSFTVGGFEKILLTPANFGFFGTIADLWITSNAPIFGGTLYLLDSSTGRLITTIPHIDIENF